MAYNPEDLDNGWYGDLPKATEAGVRKLLDLEFFSGIAGVPPSEFSASFHSEVLFGSNMESPTSVRIVRGSTRSEHDAALLYNRPSVPYIEFIQDHGLQIDWAKVNRLRSWHVGDENNEPPPPPPPESPIGAPVPHIPNGFACTPAGYFLPVGHLHQDATGTYVKRRNMIYIYWEKIA